MEEIHIAGTGIWYPEDVITNDEIVISFNKYVDNFNSVNKDSISAGIFKKLEHSSVEFIEKASGIKTRHVVDKKNILDVDRMMPSLKHEDESRLSIHAVAGIEAAKKAMKQADVTPDDIDAVILGTSHNARYYPAVAIEIQNELGIEGYAYDMLVGCSSTTFAINNAYSDIASGLAETILVVNPEISTPAVNFGKRDIHFIFGDGCVASVIKKNSSSDKSFKIIDRKLMTQFSNNIRSDWSYLARTASDHKTSDDLIFNQNGGSVFKEVCPLVAEFISTQLEKNNIKVEEISKFWLHQANARMINLIVSKIIGSDDFDTDLAPLPIETFGNLASAGSMFAFNLNNDLESGEKGIICSFGAGYSVCSIIVEKI